MRKRSSTRRLLNHTFFTDRDLGKRVPQVLEEAGLLVERHDDHFDPLTPDVEWLRVIGERGWVALSHNKEIRYNTEERDMVMRGGVPLILLIGHATHDVLAQNFLNTIDRVEIFLSDHSPPFIARVYRPTPVQAVEEGKPGRIAMWLTHDEWIKLKSSSS